MSAPPPIDTPRLRLRPLTMDDAPAIQAHFPVMAVVKYLDAGCPWPYPADGAVRFCASHLQKMTEGTHWVWTLRLASAPDEVIGVITLADGPQGNRSFWLGTAWHGQRLMTEASAAVTTFWFTTLGRPVLRVSKAVENVASRRLSQAEGMRCVSQDVRACVGGAFLMEVYEITAEEWRTHQRGDLGRVP